MFRAPNVVLVARASGVGGLGFLACQLLALGLRDRDFKPTLGSAAFEHLGAMLFALFILGLTSVLRKWERADSEVDTPASDDARAAGALLAGVLLLATAARIAAELGDNDSWQDLAVALDIVCLLPLVVLMPFMTIVTLAPGAPTGFAIAGWIVALCGLLRASALFVESDTSIFARSAPLGSACFALFVIWVAFGGFLAFRVKHQ
jgi:hypothetical protein